MEITQILCYLLAYCVFLLLQAVMINGIKISASGHTEKSPSGEDIDSEMILYPLYKWLTQSQLVKVYYQGPELGRLVEQINKYLSSDYGCNDQVMFVPKEDHFSARFPQLQVMLGHQVQLEVFLSGSVGFYKELKVYRYSKYLRKPIIQCVICMASFWGFFTYWPVIYFVYGVKYFTFILWIVNTFCLSYINFLIFKANK